MVMSASVKDEVELSCPFCFDKIPLKNYEIHAGKHQQELALFALPNIDGYTSTWTEHKKKPDRWSRLWNCLSWYMAHAKIAITSLGLKKVWEFLRV